MLLNRSTAPLVCQRFSQLVVRGASAQLTIEADVIYGRKDGMALTYDVLKPENANGAAVIFMMSGVGIPHGHPRAGGTSLR